MMMKSGFCVGKMRTMQLLLLLLMFLAGHVTTATAANSTYGKLLSGSCNMSIVLSVKGKTCPPKWFLYCYQRRLCRSAWEVVRVCLFVCLFVWVFVLRSINSKDPKVFKLGISYKWYGFVVERSKVKVKIRVRLKGVRTWWVQFVLIFAVFSFRASPSVLTVPYRLWLGNKSLWYRAWGSGVISLVIYVTTDCN